VHIIFLFPSFSSYFLWLWICRRSARRLASITTLHNMVWGRGLIALSLCDYVKLCVIGILQAAAKMPWTVSYVSTCPLEESHPVQLNDKCTDMGN
jgi:hypothetical protein